MCVLCGPQPSLAELERLIGKSWRPALPHLAALQVFDFFGPFVGDEGDGDELWKEMRDLLSVVVTS